MSRYQTTIVRCTPCPEHTLSTWLSRDPLAVSSQPAPMSTARPPRSQQVVRTCQQAPVPTPRPQWSRQHTAGAVSPLCDAPRVSGAPLSWAWLASWVMAPRACLLSILPEWELLSSLGTLVFIVPRPGTPFPCWWQHLPPPPHTHPTPPAPGMLNPSTP